MEITKDIKYIGVNDHQVDLFEGQYVVPKGMAYNSYVIMDEKIAVMDTVDIHFTEEWLNNLKNVLGDRQPDYLIIQHMEPDHSANIEWPHAAAVRRKAPWAGAWPAGKGLLSPMPLSPAAAVRPWAPSDKSEAAPHFPLPTASGSD